MQIERKNTCISKKVSKIDEIASLNHSSWTLKEITGLKARVSHKSLIFQTKPIKGKSLQARGHGAKFPERARMREIAFVESFQSKGMGQN